MVNNEECRKKFDKIINGIDNEGFADWRKWIAEQIINFDEEKMQNMIKRNEIRLKRSEQDDEFRLFSMNSQFTTIIAMLIPFAGTIVMTALNTQIGTLSLGADAEVTKSISLIVENTMQEVGKNLISFGVSYGILFAVLATISKYIDAKKLNKKNWDKIYYEELLYVLREELEKKQRQE